MVYKLFMKTALKECDTESYFIPLVSLQNVSPDPRQNCGPYTPLEPRNYSDSDTYIQDEPQIDDDELWMHGVSGMINSPEEDPDHDTICMLGIDQQRNLVAGVSTNGLNYKIPG